MTLSDINAIGAVGATSVSAQSVKSDGQSDFSRILQDYTGKAQPDLESLFNAAAQKYNISASLLKAVAKTESNFNARATSPCGAMGIMQLMPATAQSLGVTDAYDPEQNIMGGAKCLSQMLAQFGGNTELALAAYNAGPGNVLKYNGIPPFEETLNYVAKVLGYCGSSLPGSYPSQSPDSLSDSFSDTFLNLSDLQQESMNDDEMNHLLQELLMNNCQMQMLAVLHNQKDAREECL